MHITKQVRALLVKKCGLMFGKMVSEAVFFNYIRTLEEYTNQQLKKSLYDITEEAGSVDGNRRDDSYTVFYRWVMATTSHIEKTENKGRKVVRKIKGLQTKYTDELPYALGVGNTLYTLYSTFLLNEEEENSFIETYGVENEHKIVKQYLIGLLVLDEVEEKEQELNLLELMIMGEGNAIFNGLTFIGQAVLCED